MSNSMRTILVGFIAGAASVLIFHQFGFWLATELGWARSQIYNMRPVPPLGVPTIISAASCPVPTAIERNAKATVLENEVVHFVKSRKRVYCRLDCV